MHGAEENSYDSMTRFCKPTYREVKYTKEERFGEPYRLSLKPKIKYVELQSSIGDD